MSAGKARTAFPWPETGARLREFAAAFPAARADAAGRAFQQDGSDRRLLVPFVLPAPQPGEPVQAYAQRLPDRVGRSLVVLLQAGAMAMGYWDEDELLRHKAQKRYVVRGHGKAQPLHLETKGRSRYGSRLRLQNWRRLLLDVTTRWRQWWDEFGAAEQVFLSVPVRIQSDLWGADPPPPVPFRDPTLRRVPRHVHVPDHEELLRVGRWLRAGAVEHTGE